MSLFTPKTEADGLLRAVGMSLLECDRCHERFSSSMIWAWPFCKADIPHIKMTSKEQLRRKELLSKTPEEATTFYIEKMIELYGTSQLSVSWKNNDLSKHPPVMDVRTPIDTYKRFSDNYKVAGVFIGNVLGKHNWAMLDLFDYSQKAWPKTPNP